jgi:outer membrane biosynthesis protein TonB
MAFRRRRDIDDLLRMGGVSLAAHIVLVILLSLSPWSLIIKAQPMAYTVTLVAVSPPEPETQIKEPLPSPKPIEKMKPITKPKKDDIVEKVKKPSKKVEKPKEKKADLNHLQEALEEIRREVALEEIQKRVARRQKVEERPAVAPSDVPVTSSSKTSSELDSKLNQYYSMIWTKIKKAWTIPENLLKEKERVDLETIIVVIIERDGKIQKYWFEKKSGNDLYDQMAVRAIKKAEPLPPVPNELSEKTLELGIRFFPD